MQKKFEVLMICCLFVSSFLLARAGAAFVSAKSTTDSPKCIVLDAGHGGSDPGKVGCGDVLEKDINLAIVYKLKTLFENKGFKVVLTRTDDKPLAAENSKNMKIEDMRNRVALITETMPVMTISIHQNSFPDSCILLRPISGRRSNCSNFTGYFKYYHGSSKTTCVQVQ